MVEQLKLLLIEDSEDDAAIVQQELQRGGFKLEIKRIETSQELTQALDNQEWDAIISDYNLPHFSAPAALNLVQKTGRDIPFIVVTGAVKDEEAVAVMKNGAHDYIFKNNLKRLVPAIRREIKEKDERRKRREAEELIKLDEARLESLLNISQYEAENVREFLDYALDEVIRLTGSKIGYIYLYNQDKQEFTLSTWSKDVMKERSIVESRTVIHLDKVGIWGEAVRQRKPIVMNDFQEPNPLKKGYPEGHAVICRWMTVPVFNKEKIVAVAGLANKTDEYNQADVRQATLLMDSVWKYLENKQSQEALKKSEQLLKESQTLGKIASYEADITTHEVIWSDEMYELFERDKKLPPPNFKEIYDYFSPEEGSKFLKLAHLADEGNDVRDDITATLPSGKTTIFHILIRPIKDDTGKVIKHIGIIQDITERKQVETRLRESEAKFRLIAENASDIIFQAQLRPYFKFTYISPSVTHLTGYTPEEHYADPTLGFKIVHPDDEALLESMSRMETSADKPVTLRWIKKNGQIIWIEMQNRLIIDDTNNNTSIVSICRDITAHIQAEKQIKEGYENLQKSYSSITKVISATIELRDPYTSGHQGRVAQLARTISTEMSFPEDMADHVFTAGLIHDIGKISIPAEILSKPGILNELEFTLIKTHVQAGYNVIKNIEFPFPLSRWILEHHERLDGSGYPSGLTDGQISLEAKILAVADVLEAMASHRPYRASLGIDKALNEISSKRNIIYHADVVDACLKLFRDKGFKFE